MPFTTHQREILEREYDNLEKALAALTVLYCRSGSRVLSFGDLEILSRYVRAKKRFIGSKLTYHSDGRLQPELTRLVEKAQLVSRKAWTIGDGEAVDLIKRLIPELAIEDTKAEQPSTAATESTDASPPITPSKRELIDSFIAKLKGSGRKIIRKDIWMVAGYESRTDFERFQRGDIRTTRSAADNFNRVLGMNPVEFIQSLGRLKTPK